MQGLGPLTHLRPSSQLRIAIGGFQHETNTFSTIPTSWEHFVAADTWPGLLQADALLDGMTPLRNIPISGFIEAARASATSIELLPLAWCAAGPSGRVTREAFERMLALLVDGAVAAMAAGADALYLDLHGAMAAEHIDDADGEILRRLRQAVGDIPLIASLDLHANVSPLMLQQADLLLAYRTYPHVDMAATGARAFDWVMRRLQGQPRPALAWRRVPYLIPLCWQATETAPAQALVQLQNQLETEGQALVTALAMGFPAADVEKCGPLAWAYAEHTGQAEAAAEALLQAAFKAEAGFNGDILDPTAAVARALDIVGAQGGPVIIADAQDNPGAGGSGDTMGLLRAMVEANAQNAVIGLVVDAQAAGAAHAAGVGAQLRLALGGKSGVAGDAPFTVNVEVVRLHAGQVDATGSVFRGYRLQLGPSALLKIGGVLVIVVSQAVQLLDLALLRFVGLDPQALDIIAVKSTVHFRADFEPLAQAVLMCAAPGSFALDPATLPWRRLPVDIRRAPLAQ